MRTSDFAYQLDEGLLALRPRPRGTSRLLLLDRHKPGFQQLTIRSLPALLQPGDLLLVNDVRVLPARLFGRRPSGGRCELLLLRPRDEACWEALAKPAGKMRPGQTLLFPWGQGRIQERLGEGRVLVVFAPPLTPAQLAQVGEVPLPPYIAKKRPAQPEDRVHYQTVYAREGQAVAAPTAGLHFTPELLQCCRERGVEVASLTLHVGPGTFKPVKSEDPTQHRLDPELYEIGEETAGAVNTALRQGRRIVCVGTTVVRALEDALAKGGGRLTPRRDWAATYILPGYRFLGTGALLTNFHLPRSTLLMLVAALAGRRRILAAYEQAKAWGFAFYSYGDAMFIC